jgi:hypothetical protein
MRKFRCDRSAVAVLALLGAAPLSAGDFTLGVTAATPGLGAELGYAFNEHVALRVGGYGFNYDYDGEESGVNYESELELRSGALLVDWHPLGGVFAISAGVYANGNELNATGVADAGGEYEIGGETFTAAEVGTLGASVDFNSTAPYLGLGWRSRGGEDGGFGWHVDLGVLFQGSPDVELTSTGGSLSGNALLQAEIDAEEADLENEIDQYEFYPVLGLGLSWTF